MVSDQARFEHLKGFFRSVGVMEEIEVSGRDGAGVDQPVEVEDLLPVFGAVDDDGDVLGELVSLNEGENFKHLVDGAKAAGKDDQRLGQVGKPQLAHEEVVELEVERRGDIGVGSLLEGQADVEADGLAASLIR